ncbi:DUF155-domain-containing protein [Auriculariales sp. MPI-PUGE-AT-0066]|nr:DUF155-domain-containing protein [Auriculariales sp. MPI-PUGE-AT-0066]
MPSIPQLRAGAPPGKRERRPSVGAMDNAANKVSRSTKTSQKVVVLPTEAQTSSMQGFALTEETHHEGERMTKDQREQAGYRRLTAYCVAESFKLKLMAAFLKREHAVTPRMYEEALYAAYWLPLLPGYSQEANLRSSLRPKPRVATQPTMTDVEEDGYEGTYFADQPEYTTDPEGFIPSSSPRQQTTLRNRKRRKTPKPETTEYDERVDGEQTADVIFFNYGVVVFYGFDEGQERAILEDVARAGTWLGGREEEKWEVEQCHYVYDPMAPEPRIFNDFFTFKSKSHLLKLSVSHALAQSTLLAVFESRTAAVLSHSDTVSLPRRLASQGALKLHRAEAMQLTGRLFKLRRDVNLVSNVLDTPELFWSEASLVGLYEACRQYFEVDKRVETINEKLKVASDLLDIIHEHLNNGAMERITWIIIWLIVAACLVEFTEVLARLIVDARRSGQHPAVAAASAVVETAQPLRLLKRIITPSPVRLASRLVNSVISSS